MTDSVLFFMTVENDFHAVKGVIARYMGRCKKNEGTEGIVILGEIEITMLMSIFRFKGFVTRLQSIVFI